MADSNQGTGPREAIADRPDKQPYEKPAVAWEEALEVRPALMAQCAKISGSGYPCDSGAAS